MSTFRKVLLGILFLGVVAGIGYGIYYFFFKPTAAPVTPVANVNTNTPGNGLTPSGAGANLPYVPPLTGGGYLPPASAIARGGATVRRPWLTFQPWVWCLARMAKRSATMISRPGNS